MKAIYESIRTVLFLTLLGYLNSCKEKMDPINPIVAADSTAFTVEDAYPNTKCVWQDGTLFGKPIRYGIINNEAIYEGDIILTPEQLASASGGRVSGVGSDEEIKRWQNFTIPYTIDPNLPNQKRVTDAIAHWEAKTPLRFVLRTTQPDYVTFMRGNGSDSNLGRIGRQQTIRLSSEAITGSVIHEIGHLVGLLHEHTRSDRHNFITIHLDNIDQNDRDQFIKHTEDDDRSGFDFGNYDLGSVMHYHSHAFAIDKTKPTITRNDGVGNHTFGQRVGLSSKDRQTVTAMYASLYIIAGGNLWAICVKDGSYARVSGGWNGFNAKTMAEDGRYLWAIQGDNLWRVDRLTSRYKSFGNGWNGALGITSIVNPSHLWAIKGNDLYAIDKKNGKAIDVDNFNWAGSTAILAHRDFLFIVDGGRNLWKSNMNTGKWRTLDGVWTDAKAMAVTHPNADALYIINESTLWRVNIHTGKIVPVGRDRWAGTKGMVGIGGKLYIVQDETLWEVDQNGNRRSLGINWGTMQSMGIIRNGNIVSN